VKSPVEFALGIVVPLEAIVPTAPLGRDLARLGQDLGSPPTANGWEGGRAWINEFTLLGRSNLAAALLGPGEYGGKLDPQAVARKHDAVSPETTSRFLLELFLQSDVPDDVRRRIVQAAAHPKPGDRPDELLRRLAHTVVTLPEFQLS
jgi:hypothetical protein